MAEKPNNEIPVEAEVAVEHNDSNIMPRAHGFNQINNSTPTSAPGFIPHGNANMGTNNLNNHSNPALGQRRMHNNDLDKQDANNKKNDDSNDGKNKKDSGKDNESNPDNSSNKEGKDSAANSNKNSLPSADPNKNINANAANMNSNKPATDSKNSDNKFDSKKNKNSSIPAPTNKRIGRTNNSRSSKSTSKSSSILNATLNEMWQNPVIRRKIIIGAGIVFGVLFVIVVFVALFSSLFVTLSSSMCDNSGTFSYSGSGDIAEFMCGMQEPAESYTVTSNYGYSVDSVHSGRLHSGIDLGVSTGTPVYAAQSGKVVGTNTASGYGNDVVIDHGGGVFTRYGHNSKLLVSKGDFVNKGQEIAKAGSTGNSTGPHIHFEIMKTTESNLFSGHQDPNAYFNQHDDFMNSCGSYAGASYDSTSVVTTTGEQKPLEKITKLKTLSKSTGTIKYLTPKSGYAFQSFAYNNGNYYVQMIHRGRFARNGYIYKYNSNLKKVGQSPSEQKLLHGNGLAYSTTDNMLYSVSTKSVGSNTHVRTVDPTNLKIADTKKLLKHASAIAYDRITNRFVTALKSKDVYVYNSNLSDYAGAKRITKLRADGSPGDIAAYGGIVYITIWASVGNNHIDMYNEDTGEYLGSYEAPYYEIEGIDIDDSGQIVLLFHTNKPFLQFTGIKANVINGSSDASASSGFGNQCCTDSSASYTSASGSEYCPNGITVTGNSAGTYSLDEYVERVVTAENGGAHEEALKALAIAARTYAINRTNNCEKTIPNSTAAQVMADKASDKVKNALQSVRGSVMLYNGNYFSAEYSSFLGTCSGSTCSSTFVKVPSNEKATFTMPKSYLTINAGHERGLSQNGSNYMAQQGKTYREILEFFYADGIEITGASAGGNSCSLGASGTYSEGNIWDYSQADYSDPYCGGTIADSGCGPTSMAMVVSTFLKEKHDPPELAKITTDTGYCSTKTHDYFKKAAEKYNLTYQKLSAGDSEEVLTALNRGDSLVIANVTNDNKVDGQENFWTPGGHYIVLAGHSGRDVWVQDPNKGISGVNRTNTKGDGVYNFDKYIKPAATNGYMIFKKA